MRVLSIVLVMFAVVLSSCNLNELSGTDNKDEETASLEFSISLAKAPVEIISMSGFLSRSGEDTIKFDFTIKGDNAYCKVKEIKPGDWKLTVNAYNANYELAYNGSTIVKIEPGIETKVYLHLDPATGSLRVVVTWGTDITHGLVACYPFNGNADDESGNGNNGIVNGATLCEDRFGSSNSAYCFDGMDDYIVINDSDNLTPSDQNMTISLWFRTNFPGDRFILYKGSSHYNREYAIGIRFDSLASFQINHNGNWLHKSGVQSMTKLKKNIWYHLVCTWDGYIQKIYLNGQLVNAFKSNLVINNYESNLYIGTYGGSINQYAFNGSIDNIMIFNRVIDENEIQLLYNDQN